jgi:hypothetical protein
VSLPVHSKRMTCGEKAERKGGWREGGASRGGAGFWQAGRSEMEAKEVLGLHANDLVDGSYDPAESLYWRHLAVGNILPAHTEPVGRDAASLHLLQISIMVAVQQSEGGSIAREQRGPKGSIAEGNRKRPGWLRKKGELGKSACHGT